MPNELLNRERLAAVRSIAAERPVRIRITGDCMAPRLRDNAYVWVQARRRYWPGDALVIRSPAGALMAHRLIGAYRRRGHWRWLTQADSTPQPDFAVTASEIIGRLSGGECSPELISVPLRHRVWAAWRFLRFALIDRWLPVFRTPIRPSNKPAERENEC
jgi:hypothetical protein